MSTDQDAGKPKQSVAKPDEAAPPKADAKADAAKPAAKKPDGKLPPFDERRLKFAEIAPFAAQLDAAELVAMANDGRAIVRANAVLALAALNQPVFEVVAMLRDSDSHAAAAAAEAVGRLGVGARTLIPQIVQALGSAHTEIAEAVNTALSELVGKADDELILALDVPYDLAMKSIVEAARKIGKAGIKFLIKAAGHERIQIRVNAIGGLERLGKADLETSMAFLTTVEANDPVPDVRTAAKQAMLAVIAREKVVAVDNLPKNIPDFETRKLSGSELREYADAINIDEMVFALQDGRAHVKVNAARALGIKGDKAARAANALGVNLRDSVPAVRKEMAVALGKLGAGALDAAQDLVGALGDAEEEVTDAAIETVAGLGESARDALIRGLDAGSEAHGLRVGELIGRLPKGAETMTEAFKSPAVNVQVNAALGLGLLRDKVGSAGLAALHGARTGGDARTREAVRRALDMIEPKGPTGPKAVTIDGFEDRFLDAKDIEKAKAEVEKVGAADLTAYLMDGRDVVRANAATALAALGPAGASAAGSLGVRLRDDSPRVRLASAQALDKLGDAVVVETANDLVGALRDADDKVAEATAAVLRARKGKVLGALIRGLETDDPRHGRRICEVINKDPEAADILAEAFDSPAVNVQVNAALGLGMLGADRVGKGRKKLEGARTGGDARTREAVRAALDTLDGPRQSGPRPVDVPNFETQLLGPEAFTDPAKLRHDDLLGYLTDGRAIVRANSATALASLGPAAAGAATAIGVLLRDDDMKVRIAAAQAVDKLGDDAVKEIAAFLVGALKGDADVTKAVQPVLASRKTKVLTALLKGLETDDETQARRILEVINALPDAQEILVDAFDSPAENVQVNAAMGIGMLGAKRAGAAGKKKLEGARTGGFASTREAVFKALAMLK